MITNPPLSPGVTLSVGAKLGCNTGESETEKLSDLPAGVTFNAGESAIVGVSANSYSNWTTIASDTVTGSGSISVSDKSKSTSDWKILLGVAEILAVSAKTCERLNTGASDTENESVETWLTFIAGLSVIDGVSLKTELTC